METLEERILNLLKQLEEEKRLADKRAKQLYNLAGGAIPVGTIVPYLGGYFTDGENGGFTMIMAAANTVAAVNTLLNPSGFYVCDGAALNLGDSAIFNGAGRYLPNLTDDRFIMGDTLGGTPGGDNAMAHTHAITVNNHTLLLTQIPAHGHGSGTLATNNLGAHQHQMGTSQHAQSGGDRRAIYMPNESRYYTGTQVGNHAHSVNAGSTANAGGGGVHNHGASSGAATNTENRPKFLGCFYIMRAI